MEAGRGKAGEQEDVGVCAPRRKAGTGKSQQ